jgi:mannose-6-phosphate isomerase-like protein (cupin superfamily)
MWKYYRSHQTYEVTTMNYFKRAEIDKVRLPGRVIQTAVGKEGISRSQKMTMGFAHYSAESGPMEPHHHAEEVVYIIDTRDGWMRYGPGKEQLGECIPLQAGMVLHIPPLEWHVFGYEVGGYVDIAFIYGQVDQIRPEEMTGQ